MLIPWLASITTIYQLVWIFLTLWFGCSWPADLDRIDQLGGLDTADPVEYRSAKISGGPGFWRHLGSKNSRDPGIQYFTLHQGLIRHGSLYTKVARSRRAHAQPMNWLPDALDKPEFACALRGVARFLPWLSIEQGDGGEIHGGKPTDLARNGPSRRHPNLFSDEVGSLAYLPVGGWRKSWTIGGDDQVGERGSLVPLHTRSPARVDAAHPRRPPPPNSCVAKHRTESRPSSSSPPLLSRARSVTHSSKPPSPAEKTGEIGWPGGGPPALAADMVE